MPPREGWQTWLKIGLGLLLFGLAFRSGFQPLALAVVLQTVQPGWVVVSLALVIAGSFFKAVRWWLLLAGLPQAPRLSQTLGPLLTGQAFNMLAWARIGDLVRLWLVSAQSPVPLPAVAATLVIENVFELCAFGSSALILYATLAAIPSAAARLPLIFAASLGGLVVLVLAVHQGERLLSAAGRILQNGRFVGVGRWLAAAVTTLSSLKQGRRFWPVVGLTILIWLVAWLTNVALFRAFSLELPPAAGLLVLVLIIIGVAPGLMPTNIGPFYFLTVVALQQYEVEATVSVAYAVILHALVTGVPVLGAATYLALQWQRTGARPRLTPPPTWPKP